MSDGTDAELAVMSVRALGDRGLPCDVIDVYAARRRYSPVEMEQLGLRDAGADFDLFGLRDRLESVVWVSDEEFAAHGLDAREIAELRRWALEWESDLGLRLAEDYDDEPDPDGDWPRAPAEPPPDSRHFSAITLNLPSTPGTSPASPRTPG
ncbi:hypothetical protein [Streptomyces sp. NPDC101776]|uniref:hypothetical protein n=1 Tax=Streptomyces sp. NPDC101776 TaxID=3366146 RepID=UPI0038013B82